MSSPWLRRMTALVELTEVLKQADVLWAVLDDYSAHVRDAYTESVDRQVRLADAERIAHLDVLLTAGHTESSTLFVSAAALGLPRTGSFHVVVTQGMTQQERESWTGTTALWREYPDVTAGLLTAGPTLPDVKCRIGISTEFDNIADAAVAVQRARTALACLPPGTSGVVRYGEQPTACLVAACGTAAAELTRLLLGPVLEQPELLETLAAWFAAAGSPADTAKALNCHQNTVRYRLRRVEALTGRVLSDPRSIADFAVAVHSLSQSGGDP